MPYSSGANRNPGATGIYFSIYATMYIILHSISIQQRCMFNCRLLITLPINALKGYYSNSQLIGKNISANIEIIEF